MTGSFIPLRGEPMTKEAFAARHIREAIVAGRLQPGDKLRQQHIALELGISPTPVREALRRLVTEGWLQLTPNKGVTVAQIHRDNVDEIYRLRALLEGELAAEAARAVTPAALKRIRRANTVFRKASGSHDFSAAREANYQFHVQVWEAANAPLTVEICNSLWARTPWETMNTSSDRDKRSIKEHAEIIEALATGDPELARKALVAHIASGLHDYHDIAQSQRDQALQIG